MKKRSKVYLICLATVVLVAVLLHTQGYKIYGNPHMYRCAPPENEAWIKVDSTEADHLKLSDGQSINLAPFHLTQKALELPAEELAKRLFTLAPDDIYVRKIENQWIVRAGNRYLYSHPSFFPKREYGYYENELIDHISRSEINVPLGGGLIEGESEEAIEIYYKSRAR